MTSGVKLLPDVQKYLENSLCRFKEPSGSDECKLWFSQFLNWLSVPPMVTTLRINFLKASVKEICQSVNTVLIEQYAKRKKNSPMVYIHPQVDDCLIITNDGPFTHTLLEKEVIVDTTCGAAVLRGSDIYACGILAAPLGMQPGDMVSVYADLDGLCRSGLTKTFDGPKIFLGNGTACLSRHDIFSTKQQGVGIEMTDPLYLAPSLSGILTNLVFPQNLPSVVCVHVLDPQPGETILDMCAAPGGKTTHIGTLMRNQGKLIALDKSRNKIGKIQENIGRWELTCVDVYCFDGTKSCSTVDGLPVSGPPPYSAGIFDRVLLDAPCSGLGRRPALANRMSVAELKSYPPLQRKLFKQAVLLLKENGVLVYSTCTITREENEDIVAWALESFPNLQLVEQTPHLGGTAVSGNGLDDAHASLLQRFSMNISNSSPTDVFNKDTIGFFIAKFVKLSNTPDS